MNDVQIRESFHQKRLRRYHQDSNTLVIDELGLNHGKYRADIAVLNGCLIGFEIKGERDSLARLPRQILAYDAIFDRTSIIVTARHLVKVKKLIPRWWGVILCKESKQGVLNFVTHRKAIVNRRVDPIAVARLLWRAETVDILRANGEQDNIIRKPRAFLYSRLVKLVTISELKDAVRFSLLRRTNWRHLKLPFEGGDLSQPIAKS